MISQKTRPRNTAGIPAGASTRGPGRTRTPLGNGPRIEKQQLHVEQKKDDRDQVKPDIETLAGVRRRVHARLVGHLLDFREPSWARKCARHDHARGNPARHEQQQKDRRELGTHRSITPLTSRPTFVKCFTKSPQKNPGNLRERAGTSGLAGARANRELVNAVRGVPCNGPARDRAGLRGPFPGLRSFIVWNESLPSTSYWFPVVAGQQSGRVDRALTHLSPASLSLVRSSAWFRAV